MPNLWEQLPSAHSEDLNDAGTFADHASARAQTTWSGTVTVTTEYTVAVFDELIVSACTQIELGAGARIYVEGRLTVEGTSSCPVVMYSFASSDGILLITPTEHDRFDHYPKEERREN